MSEQDHLFLRKFKYQNFIFLGVQLIILIFFIGVFYNRVLVLERANNEKDVKIDLLETRLNQKADISFVEQKRVESNQQLLEMKVDLKADLKEIRTILLDHVQGKRQ